MTKYILWVWFISGSGVGYGPVPTLASAEYNSEKSCNDAVLELQRVAPGFYKGAVCTKK